MKSATDRTNELLYGDDAAAALKNCLRCANHNDCVRKNWPVTCDKDGTTCDNYVDGTLN